MTSVLVYTGSSGALTFVAANDDACGVGLGLQSQVSFTSDGASTYYIAVEGYNITSFGEFTMNISCSGVNPPAVDNQTCGSALSIPADGTETISDNSYGDVAATQPTCDLFGSIQDVWFSFIAPASGSATLTVTNGTMTSSNFAVYSGSCGALVAVGDCYRDVIGSDFESLTGLMAGSTYYVQVWSNSAEQGTFTIDIDGTLATQGFDAEKFSYYPNPVHDNLNLVSAKNIDRIQLYNLLGQSVIDKSPDATQSQIDVSDLTAGIYIGTITSDGARKTFRIVKN